MSRPVTITQETRQQVIQLRQTGQYTLDGIANIARVSRSTVQIIVANHQYNGNGQRAVCWPDEPAPQPKIARRQCRAIGFETFRADYMRCWTCKFRWFNGYGKPTFCPRCHTTDTRVIYRPANGNGKTTDGG